MESICVFAYQLLQLADFDSMCACLFPHRKRTMFQNIVNATEPMPDEKEAIAFVSNNPVRKEIIMYVSQQHCPVLKNIFVKRLLKQINLTF